MGYREMGLLFDFQTKILQIDGLGFHGDARFLVIRLHNPRILKLLARAVILALVIVSFPWLTGGRGESRSFLHEPVNVSDDILPLAFHDLANEGLLKQGDRVLLVSNNGDEEAAIYKSQAITDYYYSMDLVSVSDIARQSLVIPEETYDLAFPRGLTEATSDFVNRALKVGGVVVLQMAAVGFSKLPNYKIVYLRKFESTAIVAMKKIDTAAASDISSTRRQLLEIKPEARVAALKNLEDVLLEPPRAASGKSNTYSKRTRYLPDLMGVSLENYPRRVFIDVSSQGKNDETASDWFKKHYHPSKSTEFELFQIEAVAVAATEPSSGGESAQVIGMSDWLRKNVEENDYVVMKTEVEVAEEMVKSRAIRLVDELFLECKHQGIKKGGEKSRRAYWECLALYGSLRDEGVAVHQWWG